MEQKKNKTNLMIGILIILIIVIIAVAIISIVLINNSSDDKSDSSRSDKKTEAVADNDGIGTDSVDDEQSESDDATEEEDDEELVRLRHAPNIYVQWLSPSYDYVTYDAFTVNWKCTETADYTYWAVHNWDGGYAGFQDRGEQGHMILMSLWDLADGTQPQVEYYSDPYDYGDFNHEGCGAYVFTPYEWEVGVWYSMKIEITYEANKTIFTQYVREDGGEWLRTAALSYPAIVEIDYPTHMFQEDYDFNDLSRSCMMNNAAGRIASTGEWENWNEFEITSSYYPDDNDAHVQTDVNFGCDYEIKSDAIEVFTGGRGDKPNGKEMPYQGRID